MRGINHHYRRGQAVMYRTQQPAEGPGQFAGTAFDAFGHDPAVGQDDHPVVGRARAVGILRQNPPRYRLPGGRVELDENVAVDGIKEAVAVREQNAWVAALPWRRDFDLHPPALCQRHRVDAGDVRALCLGVRLVSVHVELIAVPCHRDVGGGVVVRGLSRRDRHRARPGDLGERAGVREQLRAVGREVLKRRDGREECPVGRADVQVAGARAGIVECRPRSFNYVPSCGCPRGFRRRRRLASAGGGTHRSQRRDQASTGQDADSGVSYPPSGMGKALSNTGKHGSSCG